MKKILYIILFIFTVCSSSLAQLPDLSDLSGAGEVRSTDLRGLEELVSDYEIKSNNLDELKNLVRPKLILLLKDKQKIDLENSDKLRKKLDDFWKLSIEYNHTTHFIGLKEYRKHNKLMRKWGDLYLRLQKNLMKVEIITKGEKRKISIVEAYRVIGFINKLTKEIVIKARKVEGKFKELAITNQPTPRIGNCLEKSGSVKLRVTFDESAKVTKVWLIESSGCNDFDFNASDAAKKIEFTPAMLDGKPTTVSSIIVYNFKK